MTARPFRPAGRLVARIAGAFFVTALTCLGSAAEDVDFLKDVRPILATRCAKCHSASFKQEGGLRLDSPDGLAQGGESGPLFVAGKSGDSRLLQRVTDKGDQRMPPEGEPLTERQIDTLRRWIDQGAALPSAQARLRHWALEPPQPPPLPSLSHPERARGPVDVWLEQAREAGGVALVETAPRHLLVRRLCLDLIGLPPSEEQRADFLADDGPDAVERLVDRLLASPAHGERWGRHWMDVWRYSDWDGYGAEIRESQPHIWRWRDWIIESLNADRGYDRMIVEMLAGDEIAPDDPATLRATGFLARQWFKFNRNVWLDNAVEHTGKAFLGLTLNCARCHDHMYDAIRQTEYYGLRAIFEPYDVRIDRLPGQPDTAQDGLVRAFDAKLDTPTYVFTRGDEKQPVRDQTIPPALPAWLSGDQPLAVQPRALGPSAYYPNSRAFVHEETLAAARTEIERTASALAAAREALTAEQRRLRDELAAKGPSQPAPTPPTPSAPATAATPAPPAAEEARVLWSDSFQAARADHWKIGAGQFEYADGRLFQRQALNAFCSLTSEPVHPRDFQVRFRFKITGGMTYRSIGLSFDSVGDQDAQFVYLSAHAPGPKLQLGRRRAGRDEYPPEALKALPIEVGREYELQVAVRDQLLNVSVDGQFQLAFRLDTRPAGGRIALWCYDATGEFLRAEATTLPHQVKLIDPAGEAPPATTPATRVEQLELALAAAEKQAAAAQASLVAVTARVSADQATYSTPPAADADARARAAVQAEREHAVLAAEARWLEARHKLLTAQSALRPGDAKLQKAVSDAEKMVADQQKAVDTARAAKGQESNQYTRFGTVFPTSSSGRRLALAQWIASPANPLTPRVAINHVWLRHFGAPLVATVFEFGANGQPPTHPALLDWLARELVTTDWSLKALHRQLVTSETYRLSSAPRTGTAPQRERDPENRLYWRMNARRMEAEVVRDSTLAVAGHLQRQFSGPDLDPNLGLTLGRRSVYFRTSKEKKMTFLSLFDSANVSDCYRRSESIAPQQALAMVNSSLTLAQSRLLAAELTREAGSADATFVDTAFVRVLGRQPTAAEQQECASFLAAQAARFRQGTALSTFSGTGEAAVKPAADPGQRARENLVHVLFNHNDFLTIR